MEEEEEAEKKRRRIRHQGEGRERACDAAQDWNWLGPRRRLSDDIIPDD